jgi:AcrR family transcriptional regulator
MVGTRTTDRGKPQAAAGQRYHHGNLRAALIAAATAILKKDGVGGLTLRAVARGAGVSQTAPYRHFKNKSELLAALAGEGFEGLTAAMMAAMKDIEDPSARLRALGRGYVGYALANPAYLRLMFGPDIPDKSAHPELLAKADAAYAVLTGTMQAGRGARPDFDPDLAALASWALVHGLANLLIDGQIKPEMLEGAELDIDGLADRIVGFLAI